MYPNTLATKRPPSGSEPILRRYQKLQSLFYRINNFDKSLARPHPKAKAHEDKRQGTTTWLGASPKKIRDPTRSQPTQGGSQASQTTIFSEFCRLQICKNVACKNRKNLPEPHGTLFVSSNSSRRAKPKPTCSFLPGAPRNTFFKFAAYIF